MVEDGVDERMIRLRPNGVWFDDLLPLPARGAMRSKLGIPSQAPLVLTLARISGIKGLDVLARALARTEGVWGVIAGPDERDGSAELLTKLKNDLGLSDRLLILPQGLWGDRKREAFADADCFCLPSMSESFGTSVAEAAGVGLAVIVSAECGVAEWLVDTSSRIVPFGDPERLAEAIENLFAQAGLRVTAAVNADVIRERLDWSSLTGRQTEIYGELVD